MKSSSYIIELLVAGAGAVAWMLLFVFAFLGYDWFPMDLVKEAGIVLALSPFVYVIGVITDRLVDNLFDKLFKENYHNPLFLGKEEYILARTRIYLTSDSLRDLLEYGKARTRICRAWAFNSLMIMLAGDLFLLLGHAPITEVADRWMYAAVITVIFALSTYLSFKAWKTLSTKEAEFLKIQSKVLDILGTEPRP